MSPVFGKWPIILARLRQDAVQELAPITGIEPDCAITGQHETPGGLLEGDQDRAIARLDHLIGAATCLVGSCCRWSVRLSRSIVLRLG